MTSSPTLALEPACPPSSVPDGRAAPATPRPLDARQRSFDAIPRAAWDALAGANPWATPFARWAFHRAWWDAYGGTAHDQTLVVEDPSAPAGAPPVGIVPLMHRHFVEPTDALTATHIRHGSGVPLTQLPPTAKAVFFGASYHADYATILCAPADLPAVAEAVADELAHPDPDADHPAPWDAVDLRRLRCGDPAADALAAAFARREMAEGWTVNLEREDVCPVVTLPDGVDFDGFLATLGKKERHEIRRKVRRAEAAGVVRLVDSDDPRADLDAFIELHQKRWGAEGLFPSTPGGNASRANFHRLFDLLDDGTIRLSFLEVGGRRIAAGVWLEEGDVAYYYNAGVDLAARELSPGVVMVARFVERAIAEGKGRLDFLRGDEPYKYEWGALDEPIVRLLVRRTR